MYNVSTDFYSFWTLFSATLYAQVFEFNVTILSVSLCILGRGRLPVIYGHFAICIRTR